MCTTQRQHITLQQPRTCATLLWVCLWVWTSVSIGVRGGCPKMCECFWRDSKLTAACREADFIDIPRGLEPKTQVLDLSHNNLRILPRDAFVYTGLTSLQKVILSHCKLFLLEAGSFNSVERVMELDLSNNKLQRVPSAALKGLVMLRELSLAHNGIKTLAATTFTYTPHIVQLDLSHNGLNNVAVGSLRNLTDLEVLNVAENKLMFFPASELDPLKLLQVIRVDGNPWQCSCRLKPLRQWFLDRNLVASVPPSCSFPKWLAGRDWQLVGREDLICVPHVTAVAPRVLAAHGENVSLLCRIETEVETTITWLMGDTPLFNDSDMTRYLVVDFVTNNNVSFVSNLTITDVATEDQGTYRCIAENRAGVREVNFTLQVSHEVAEVRVATVTKSYMKEGLLGGMSASIVLLIMVCSLVYCKVRVGREPRRDDDSVDTAQSSRGSECEGQHKLAGYHVLPTNDMEDTSPHRQQQQEVTWNLREGKGEERQALVVEGAAVTLPPSAMPFLAGAKTDPCSGGGGGREAAQVVVQHNEGFPHRVCSRSISQVSLTNAGHYPDLLDLPPAPLQHHITLQNHHSNQGHHLGGLSAAACVRSFLPCRRTSSDAGCLPGVTVGVTPAAGGAPGELCHDLQPTPTQAMDQQDSSRSSSALNLALSQAASNAYANAQMVAAAGSGGPGHGCLGAASLLDQQGDRSESGGDADPNSCPHHHPADPCHFEYHAAQLEKFLKEYRCLQEQLTHMKQSYEAHKRAGSMPRLDCCPQGSAMQRSSMTALPNGGGLCCSCNHTNTTKPLTTGVAETSLTEPTAQPVYPDSGRAPLKTTEGYSDPTQAQIIVPREAEHGEAPTTQALGYSEGYITYPYVENPNPQGFAENSKLQAGDNRVSSPVTSPSSSRSSPKTKTSSKSSKEPLKSILKKNIDSTGTGTIGRRRGNQWTRSASCCDSLPASHGPIPHDPNSHRPASHGLVTHDPTSQAPASHDHNTHSSLSHGPSPRPTLESSYPSVDVYSASVDPSHQPPESHRKLPAEPLSKVVIQAAPPSSHTHANFNS